MSRFIEVIDTHNDKTIINTDYVIGIDHLQNDGVVIIYLKNGQRALEVKCPITEYEKIVACLQSDEIMSRTCNITNIKKSTDEKFSIDKELIM